MKKTIAFLLAFLLCLSLCACGGETDSKKDKDDEDEESEEELLYEKYSDLIDYMEEGQYEAAIDHITQIYEEEQANLPDVPEDAEELYANTTRALESYQQGYGFWNSETEATMYGNDLMQYIYENLTTLGDYKDSEEILARIVIIPDTLLSVSCVNSDNLDNKSTSTSTREYNKDGQLTILKSPLSPEMDTHILGGNLWGDRHLFYDESGKLAKLQIGYFYNETPDIRAAIACTYDDNGNLTGMEINTDGGETHLTEYTYDDNGNLIKVTCTSYYMYITTYTYNDAGALIQEVRETYSSDGTSLNNRITRTYTLDNNGHPSQMTELIQESYYKRTDDFYSTQTNEHTFTCDAQGRILSQSVSYGKIVYRNGSESNPGTVTSEFTYQYGDYYFYE